MGLSTSSFDLNGRFAVAALLVLLLAGCQTKSKSACDPNPCTEVFGKTVCSEPTAGKFACACSDDFSVDGDACKPVMKDVDVSEGIVDWSAANPQFEPSVVVLGSDGQPIKNATVHVPSKGWTQTTNANGVAKFAMLGVDEQVVARVDVAGYVPTSRTIDLTHGGYAPLEIALSSIDRVVRVSAELGGTIEEGAATIGLPGNAFVAADGGAPYLGDVVVSLSAIDPDTDDRSTMFAELLATTADGRTDVPLLTAGMIYVGLAGENGEALELANGETAIVRFVLPKSIVLSDGATVPLWALDVDQSRWIEEGSCTVKDVGVNVTGLPDRPLVCEGTVSHFSAFNIDMSVDETGCANVVYDVKIPKSAKLVSSRVEWSVRACEYENCGWGAILERSVRNVFADGTLATSSCLGVPVRWDFQEKNSTGLKAVVTATVSGAGDAGVMTITRNVTLTEDALPVLANGATSPTSENCSSATVCKQLKLTLELTDDEARKLGFNDGDGDTYRSPDDCDDANAAIHPQAREIACNGKDDDCDGTIDEPGTTWTAFADAGNPSGWNSLCATAQCTRNATEVSGNAFDENCDGIVGDRDGDSYLTASAGGTTGMIDCDDSNAAAHPGATEVAGNGVDENCDGVAEDLDGDGFLTPKHLLMLGRNTSGPSDCDDSNRLIKPYGSDRSYFASYYSERSDGKMHRRSAFCSLFDGRFAARLERNWRVDRNCDGFVSDLDGDGFTVAGDNSLGADKAHDCNDLDPRVVPISTPSYGRAAECTTVDAALNDSQCSPNLQRFGASPRYICPDVAGQPASCVDLVDQNSQPWGIYVCQQSQGTSPLIPLNPFALGSVWGPCDFGIDLPACPSGTACGGPMHYTAAYLAMLKTETGKDLTSTHWKGMCYPLCGDVCHPNATCTEPEKNVCTIVNRQASCSCNPGSGTCTN